MTRSISRVRTRVAFPTATHEDVMNPLRLATKRAGTCPCQAEQVIELVGRDDKLLRRQVHKVPSGASTMNLAVGS